VKEYKQNRCWIKDFETKSKNWHYVKHFTFFGFFQIWNIEDTSLIDSQLTDFDLTTVIIDQIEEKIWSIVR
jgi:hypothetical protein